MQEYKPISSGQPDNFVFKKMKPPLLDLVDNGGVDAFF